MRTWLRSLLIRFVKALTPKPDLKAENRVLRELLNQQIERDNEAQRAREYGERVSELIEARQMAGSGPWRVDASVLSETDKLISFAASRVKEGPTNLRETVLPSSTFSDLELALENVEWRREINLSWLEFSRWGIQQMILISRLHYVKNPWIQRAINIVSSYVFGRGVEVMSEDEDANATLKDFFERNKHVVGQAALTQLQKRLLYDGQVFFVLFSDALDTGETNIRTIDATEIFEIETDPDDTDTPWFYHRRWGVRIFDPKTGKSSIDTKDAYYPAMGYDPPDKPQTIGSWKVMWGCPVIHFKGGTGVAKWHFDCPKAYAALDWAKAGRRWLEACATIRQALSQFAMTLTTKGGQQALEGAKQQLQTSVATSPGASSLWDMNPPTVAGGIFASGPGTQLAAFNTRGAGGDPKEAREYFCAVALVFEIPPTMLGDMETSNLATATTLDRPTELGMLGKQERWREVLVTIATYVLNVSKGAASGKLVEKKDCRVVEANRKILANGRHVYEATKANENEIVIKVNFPAIREDDLPMRVKAIVEAMTLGTQSVMGIDEREGVGMLYAAFGVENYGEILDQQYPPTTYDAERDMEPEPEPASPADKAVVTEAVSRAALMVKLLEKK